MSSSLRRLVAVLSLFTLVAAGCNGVPETLPDTAPPGEEDVDVDVDVDVDADEPPKQLVMDVEWDLLTADPARENSHHGRYIMNAVYDTLTKLKPRLIGDESVVDISTQPDPWVAESYSVDETGTVWTFNIREGIVFSDGNPLTADDVVFSLRRLKHIAAGVGPIITATWEEVIAVDEYTVQLVTEVPDPAVPFLLTHNSTGIVNSVVARENGATDAVDAAETDDAQSFFDQNSLGSGPYMYRSFSTTSETVLVRNPSFWGDQPYYDQLVFRNVSPEVARLNVQSGRSDMTYGLTPEQVRDMPDTVTVHSAPSTAIYYLQANLKESVSALAASPDLWEAIRYGIDYEKLLRLAGEGATQACGMVPQGFNGAFDESECRTRDVERARELLARTGVEDPTLVMEFPTDFSLAGPSFGAVAEAVQEDLREIGLTIELRGAPLETWLPRWQEALPEMVSSGITLLPHENYTAAFLPTGFRGQYAGFEPDDAPHITELGVRAQQTIDADERAALYIELGRLLLAEAPYIPLFQPPSIIVASSRIKGVSILPALVTDPSLFYEEE